MIFPTVEEIYYLLLLNPALSYFLLAILLSILLVYLIVKDLKTVIKNLEFDLENLQKQLVSSKKKSDLLRQRLLESRDMYKILYEYKMYQDKNVQNEDDLDELFALFNQSKIATRKKYEKLTKCVEKIAEKHGYTVAETQETHNNMLEEDDELFQETRKRPRRFAAPTHFLFEEDDTSDDTDKDPNYVPN